MDEPQVMLKLDCETTYLVIDRTLVAVMHYPRPSPVPCADIFGVEATTEELRRMGVWPDVLEAMAIHVHANAVRMVRTWQTLHLKQVTVGDEAGWHQVTFVAPESIADSDPRRGVVLPFPSTFQTA